MKKWILTVAVLMMVALAAAACGTSSNGGNGGNSGKSGNGSAGSATAEATAGQEGDNKGGEEAVKDYKGLKLVLGVQGSGGLWGKAREEKWFEDEFGKLGVTIEWAEFQSGPPMTEAMASGKLDFAGLGNLPVVAAQAAGIPFRIISEALDGKNNVAIIVPPDSEAASISDLKGKKVTVTTGSNAFNFLHRGLKEAGLSSSDIETINLQPNESQPAFEGGNVDAWATWEPYITLEILTGKGKVLADGSDLGILSHSFYIVREKIAADYPELVTLYLSVLEKARLWEENNYEEAVKRYAGERGVPEAVIQGILTNSRQTNIPVSEATAAELQKTADFQFEIKTIRKEIKVADIIDNQFIDAALAAAQP
ncbi:sulfonate ABC transporter substrate-binding protein [Paenibacillus oryzae]|uniref:Putative aliphatic sulfonates-binding protein n=1 Tax=Paenibacillus oryzae TaxID=1844972 RepID=A0A1A5YEW0_9BACL|nr:aliphatic sulfonate ABC transporter substrate-binding protein [Paenibacillus oryzae]OBR64107.1 sulfonate ABC transporter substrate-binding protein [Paenibacillus oryzae]